MLFNGTTLNFAALNTPGLQPLGIYFTDNQPVNFTSTGVGYLTTARISPTPGQINTSCTFEAVMAYQTALGTSTGVGIGNITEFTTGVYARPGAGTGVGYGYPVELTLGYHPVIEPSTGVGVPGTAIPIVSMTRKLEGVNKGYGRIQHGTGRFGYRSTPLGHETGVGRTQSTYSSVGTDRISFTGRGTINTSVGPAFKVFYSGITIKPDDVWVNLFVNSPNYTLDSFEVVQGTVNVRNAYTAVHTSNSTMPSVRLGSVAPRIRSPYVILGKGSVGVTVTQRPDPLIVSNWGKNPHVNLTASTYPTTLGSVTIRTGLRASTATSVSSLVWFSTAAVTPEPAFIKTEALRGTKFTEALVDLTDYPASLNTYADGSWKWSDIVIEQDGGFSTSTSFSLQVGALIPTNLVTTVGTYTHQQVVLTSFRITEVVSIETSVIGEATASSVSTRTSATSHVSASSAVFMSTVTISLAPVEVHTVASKPKVTQPPLVIVLDPVTTEVNSYNEPALLSSVYLTLNRSSIATSSSGQFDRGTTRRFNGGRVVDTDDRHILNVEPLNKPGLRSINIQN